MGVADVNCAAKVKDDCRVDGLAILNGVFDVNVNLDVEYVENDVKGVE